MFPVSVFGVTEVRLKQQQAPTSGQQVPAVNMAEELMEAVEKLRLRLDENQEPRKVIHAFSETKPTLYVDAFAPCMTVLYALLLVASLRIVQNCYPEIPRITITTTADREMNDRFDRSIWMEFFFLLLKYAPAEAESHTFLGAIAQLAEMTTTAI